MRFLTDSWSGPMTVLPPLPSVTAFFVTWDSIESWLYMWLPIVFMGLIVFLIWRVTKSMPKTAPQHIKADDSPAIAWNEIAGSDEAKHELQEIVEFLREPGRFKQLGAKVPKGILLHGPPGTGKT